MQKPQLKYYVNKKQCSLEKTIKKLCGDPADLQKFKKTLTSCTLSRGTPTQYTTTSWNDPNVWDLHRPQILPYKDEHIDDDVPSNETILPEKNAHVSHKIHEERMRSGKPESMDNTLNNTNMKIYPSESRYKIQY